MKRLGSSIPAGVSSLDLLQFPLKSRRLQVNEHYKDAAW